MANKSDYDAINCPRESFVTAISHTLNGDFLLRRECDSIAEVIADEVAKDVCETADLTHWNYDDLILAIRRVIKNKLGVED